MKKELTAALDRYEAGAIDLRRAIHAHPELAFNEHHTVALLRAALESCDGIEILPQILPTALIACVKGGKEGPTTLLRADIDALAMPEDTGLDFSSKIEGVCHSCGHDLHGAVGVLMLQTLAACRDELPGSFYCVFQPAEERAAGAKALFEAGLADVLPPIDQVLGVHTAPGTNAGRIQLISGPSNASTDEVKIIVKGPGGHGAHPYRCADPVAVAAYLICQLQTVISRENPAVEPAVLTFGQINGGSAFNVIPTEVTMCGTLRAFYEEGRHKMWDAIRRVSEHCAAAMRAEAEVIINEGVPVQINDPALTARLAASAERTLGEGNVKWRPLPSPGSDDFSCYITLAPSVMIAFGTSNEDPRSRNGIHNPQNIFDERSIRSVCEVMVDFLYEG